MTSIQGEIFQAKLFKFGKGMSKDGIIEIYEVKNGSSKVV